MFFELYDDEKRRIERISEVNSEEDWRIERLEDKRKRKIIH